MASNLLAQWVQNVGGRLHTRLCRQCLPFPELLEMGPSPQKENLWVDAIAITQPVSEH